MKQFEKFLNDTIGTKELLEIYLELRQHFQELGFSESDLIKPPTYTKKMMDLFHKFQGVQKALFNQVKDYGFDIDFNEFVTYLQPLLEKINDLTPLKENGSKERTDSWDEDFE
jgi:hypothetical protein